MRADNLKLAICHSVLAALFYAVLGTLMKITEQSGTPNEVVVFFRQLIGLCALFPLTIREHFQLSFLKTKAFHLHLLRAISSLCSMYCLVFALKYLPLVDALLISYSRPLFLPIIVLLWFRKRWSKVTFYGILTGFIGVALILKPDKKMFDIAALVALASACFGSISFTCIRKLTKTDSANTILWWYLILSIPLSLIPIFFRWKTPTSFQWMMLIIIGICGLIYQMTLTRAYQYAKAFKVSSILYSTAIFGALFDWWLNDFSMDYLSLFGIALILIGSFITVRQKTNSFPPELSEKNPES